VTPLILAIEPDRSKASQLKSIASRVNAELRLADSVQSALAAMSERIPDLILTPPLLSARDDMALTDRLRQLGDRAAHLQTLTIPTLQTAEPPLSAAGMFAALRRDKSRGFGPEACEADTFAEQVAVYLKGATETRSKHVLPAVVDESPAQNADAGSPVPAEPRESSAPPLPRESPPSVALRESPRANATEFTRVEEFDLTAFISEDLLEPVPIPSAGQASTVEDFSAFLSQFDTALEKPAANTTAQELTTLLPEVSQDAVSADPALPEVLADFASEKAPAGTSDKAPEHDNWYFFDPGQTRFAALVAKLDEIATRPA
jgi:hypothetical protein